MTLVRMYKGGGIFGIVNQGEVGVIYTYLCVIDLP